MKILASFGVGTDGRDGLNIEELRDFVNVAENNPDAFAQYNHDLSDHRSVHYDLIDPASLSDHPALSVSNLTERVLNVLARLHTKYRRHKTPTSKLAGSAEGMSEWRLRAIGLLRQSGYYVERGVPEFVDLRADDHEVRKVRGERWIFIDGKKAFKIYDYRESHDA